MKTKRTVIVQCRLSSTRLANKALLPLGGRSVLSWVLSSMKKVNADRYFVATDEASFAELKPVCDEYGFECFCGDLNNVLKRFCDLTRTLKTNVIIRATADNPFLFYEAAEASAQEFENLNKEKHLCDYFTYTGLPHGCGVEVFDADSLLKAELTASSDYDREHVGPAFYNHTDLYSCHFEPSPARFALPELRTTIDTYSDYLRACTVAEHLLLTAPKEDSFTTEQILEAFSSPQVRYPLVYAPSVTKGHGTGHLRRCLDAAKESGGFVYIPSGSSLEEISSLVKQAVEEGLPEYRIISELPDETFKPVVVSDAFCLQKEQSELFKKQPAFFAIDEGSSYADEADYLIDIIPSFKIEREANVRDARFIKTPSSVRTSPVENIERILICMGGEDPGRLTEPVAFELKSVFPNALITAITSDMSKASRDFELNYIAPVKDLKETLYQYDLVITHYGLTAFEARAAGCAVILASPTELHQKLAQAYDFACLPYKKINKKTLGLALSSKNLCKKASLPQDSASLGEFISALRTGERIPCPVCQKPSEASCNRIVARNELRTYRRCSSCSLIYLSWSAEAQKKYQKSYFFEEYKNQYGKTYKEDFENIKQQCLRRIDVINSVRKNKNGTNVLDIGCAYGPFLSAAADKGFTPFGTDISEDAVLYVRTELHFPCCTSAFPDIDTAKEFGISSFDVVTMWYVIEHFKDLKSVLEKVSSVVKKNGIFAFSTPSAEGISATSNPKNFYKISPSDHFSVWEPSKAHKILGKFGFEVVKIVSTGHHPERFPSIKESGAEKGSVKWKLTQKISQARGLGDTVEIYCRKVK